MMGGAMATPGQPARTQETGPILAELDMDIILIVRRRRQRFEAEQFEALVQLAQSGVLGPLNPETARMLIIAASALPSKSELLDMLDKMGEASRPNARAEGAARNAREEDRADRRSDQQDKGRDGQDSRRRTFRARTRGRATHARTSPHRKRQCHND